MENFQRGKKVKKWGIRVLLVISLSFALAPLIYMWLVAFTPSNELFRSLIPLRLTLANLKVTFLKYRNTFHYFANSMFISSMVVLVTLLLGSIAGYSLSRFRIVGQKLIISGLLAAYMVPSIILVLGYFQLVVRLGIYNTYTGLILVDSAFTLPFTILLLKNGFDTIPREIDESAVIDGCSRIGACFRIAIPLNTPSLIASVLWSFLYAWSEYTFALILTSGAAKRPIALGITHAIEQYVIRWNLLMTMAILASLPLLVFFIVAQKYIIRGFSGGSLK